MLLFDESQDLIKRALFEWEMRAMAKDRVFQLCDIVRETSFALHKYLRHGHREVIYQRGLVHRLNRIGLHAVEQYETSVFDEDGTCLGTFPADIVVNDCLLLELKAVSSICSEHQSQIIGYLCASRIDHGLLINFGSPKLEIKKFISPRLGTDYFSEEGELYAVSGNEN